MKGSDHFKKTIKSYLDGFVLSNPEFKSKYENPNKNIDDCITYILNSVKESGENGFHDNEIYGMALHYYDEENIDIKDHNSNFKVVVNHKIELTQEEINQAKKEAIDKIYEEERKRMTTKKKPSKIDSKELSPKESINPSDKKENENNTNQDAFGQGSLF